MKLKINMKNFLIGIFLSTILSLLNTLFLMSDYSKNVGHLFQRMHIDSFNTGVFVFLGSIGLFWFFIFRNIKFTSSEKEKKSNNNEEK